MMHLINSYNALHECLSCNDNVTKINLKTIALAKIQQYFRKMYQNH